MTMKTVAILGAGITGLTAGWRLRRAGVPVTVYEAGTRTGGVMCSHREGSWLAEGGPNTILETSPVLLQFVNDLGLAGRRLYSDPAAGARYVVRGGRPVDLPTSGPAFFFSSLFSWAAKLRLLREPFIPRGTGEQSVADFVRHRLGQEFLDYAIDPLVTGIYAGDPERLSVEHAFPRVHALEVKYGSLIRGQILGARERRRRGEVSKATARKFSFDDGLQVLPDTLAAALGDAVRLETKVEGVAAKSGGWRVTVRSDDRTHAVEHSAVLLCGTAHSLARLHLEGAGLPSLSSLDEVVYPPVTSVVLGFRRADVAHPACGFGMLIPHREGFGILGTLFSSSSFARRAPADHLTLTTYVGGMRRPELAGLADGPLVDLVVRDLGRLLGVSGRPVFTHLTRWPRAIPQYEVGFGRFKSMFIDLEAKAPGLFAAGHFRDGVALSDSILAGTRAAERVQAHLSGTPALQPGARS